MHDTSTESISKWRAVGSKRNDSMLSSPGINPNTRNQSRQYRPSKQREGSNSKIFNRNRSRIQSLDNINKEDLNASQSKISNPRSHLIQSIDKRKKDSAISEVKINSFIRGDSIITESESKQTVDATKLVKGQQKVSNILMERELITLKNDYNKFKLKMLSQLETQKNYMINLVNQILESVKLQLEAIEKKYEKNSYLLKNDDSVPIFSNFNYTFAPQKVKQHEIPIIKNPFPMIYQNDPSEKGLKTEFKQGDNLSDPIAMRFNNFYKAIETMKSELNELHEMSALNKTENAIKGDSSLTGKTCRISKFIGT